MNAEKNIYPLASKRFNKRTGYVLLASMLVFLLLPWTQNIRVKGTVTTLRIENRPQAINSIIGGKIVKWYVKEGDFVKKGAILFHINDQDLKARLRKLQFNKKLGTLQPMQCLACSRFHHIKI